MTIRDLSEQKMRLVGQADEILKAAASEKRDLTPEEDAKFNTIHADIETTTRQIDRLRKQEDAARSVEAMSGRRTDPNATDSSTRPTAADADLALRGWLLGTRATEAMRAAATRLGVSVERDELTWRMLGREPIRGTEWRGDRFAASAADLAAWDRRHEGSYEARAAMGVGSGSIGGYTVPDAPMRAVEEALLAFGGMRQVATVLRTDTGADLPIPTSDDTGNKGARLAENTQVSEVDVTFGQVVLQAFKYSSKSVLVSVEFLQDTSINAGDFIGRKLGERIARIQNDEFTTGTGSSQPNGVVTAATTSSVTASGTTSCSYDNLVDLIHSVDPAYRVNGRFLLHDSALKMIRKVKVLQYSGDTVGAPLWTPGVNGLPDRILDYPYVINQSLATVATGTKSVLFGDLSKYFIRDSREITLVRLNERYADYGQVGFLAFARSDGDLIDAGTHPIKYMTQA